MLPRQESPLDRLRATWEAKAERDPLHASCPAQATWTETEFRASGIKLVADRLAAVLTPALRARQDGGPLRILDFGCGAGRLLAPLRQLAGEVTVFGVDVSQRMLTRARELVGEAAGIELVRNDGLTLQCVNRKTFHAAVCIDVLDHQPDTEWARYVLGQLQDKLVPGGTLCLDLDAVQWPVDRLAAVLAMLDLQPGGEDGASGRRWLNLSRRAVAP